MTDYQYAYFAQRLAMTYASGETHHMLGLTTGKSTTLFAGKSAWMPSPNIYRIAANPLKMGEKKILNLEFDNEKTIIAVGRNMDYTPFSTYCPYAPSTPGGESGRRVYHYGSASDSTLVEDCEAFYKNLPDIPANASLMILVHNGYDCLKPNAGHEIVQYNGKVVSIEDERFLRANTIRYLNGKVYGDLSF